MLAEKERQYLMNENNVDSNHQATLEDRIEEKVEGLPQVMGKLLYDTELLQMEGFFEPQYWEDNWEELINCRNPHVEDVTASAFSFSFNPESRMAGLGEELGKMTGRLTLYPRDVKKKEAWADLVEGFMYGLCFDGWKDAPEYRMEVLDDLLDLVETRAKGRLEEVNRREWDTFDSLQEHNKQRDKTLDRIEEILEKNGIEPTSWLVRKVNTAFWEEHDKNIFRDELSYAEELTEEKALQIAEETDLVEKSRIEREFSEILKKLRGVEWDEVTALEALENVPTFKEGFTTKKWVDTVAKAKIKSKNPELHEKKVNSMVENRRKEFHSAIVKMGLYMTGDEKVGDEERSGDYLFHLDREERMLNWYWLPTQYCELLYRYKMSLEPYRSESQMSRDGVISMAHRRLNE